MSWFGQRIAGNPYDLSTTGECITYSLKTDNSNNNNDIKIDKPTVRVTKPTSSRKRQISKKAVSTTKKSKEKPSTVKKQKKQSAVEIRKPRAQEHKRVVTKDNFI